ncbi:alpha/beta hydrolase [Anaeromyxobacter paludicola]|uniref:Peptidase S9 prolyl oligopeptidase catalytic domain-containing protein n=1 Tax=Anaeromyxobacter paludicola TaxID=2918171 RepID=A0ABN6N4Q9_9BACT|nr:alpha/beta hydrolase [Anaeromyxobacter paludicola]BDG07038.1 hypothetical protein AMPC_01510 [Anaeromyxobacter paludicola]
MLEAMLVRLHSAIDRLAMWVEDRRDRPPQPYRAGSTGPLACFDPLGPLPPGPAGPGHWTAPSPRPAWPGDRMSARCFPARGARRGTVLLVPPWKIGDPGLVRGHARVFLEAGYDVWLVCPPHHLERAAGRKSGEGFVSLDLDAMRATFEQLVLELRVLAALAASRGEVGLAGLSLGALAAAFAATGPERLDFAALVAPPSLETVLAATPIGRRYRRLAEAAGTRVPSEAAIAEALAPFDPSRRPPTAERVFIAGALHDRVVPVEAPRALARRWGVPLKVYPRGHMTLLFLCRALRRDLFALAAGPHGDAGRPARAPGHLSSVR